MNTFMIIFVVGVYVLFTLLTVLFAVDEIKTLKVYLQESKIKNLPREQKRRALFTLYSEAFISLLMVIVFAICTVIVIMYIT